MTIETWTGLAGSSPDAAGAPPLATARAASSLRGSTRPSGCETKWGWPKNGTSTPPGAAWQPARAAQRAGSAVAQSPRALSSAF